MLLNCFLIMVTTKQNNRPKRPPGSGGSTPPTIPTNPSPVPRPSPENGSAKTTFYSPFTSSFNSATAPTSTYTLQGIKTNPYGSSDNESSYIITGTTGSPFGTNVGGAVYVGAIDGSSTSGGSGSGQWINFNVPFDGYTGTSCYGADILSPGTGAGGIGILALVGTWTKNNQDGNNVILGFYYEGSLDQLEDASAAPSQFKTFQAVTRKGDLADYTYLHSIDGGYAVGNFSTQQGYVGFFLNSGADSGSYVYNPITNSQVNAVYNDQYTLHTLFGIWLNKDNTYTVAGGGTTQALLEGYVEASQNLPGAVAQGLPQDAAFGRGMLADMDPITGIVNQAKYYNYLNDTSGEVFTHFQGIYYAGNGVYQVPFDTITSAGKFDIGIAYIKRQDNGLFSDNALWQTFPRTTAGVLTSNDSVAGAASVGALVNVNGSLTTFASISETQAYLFAANFLQ